MLRNAPQCFTGEDRFKKEGFELKGKKLISLLTALTIGASALLTPGLPVRAAETAAPPQAVSLADILVLRDFLLGHGFPEDAAVLDMDQNGALDARDLTLAKRAYLNAASEDVTLRNLRADNPNILLNEETNVTFTVTASQSGLPANAVALYESGSETPAAYLHDDGKDGDSAARDGIYSAQLTLASDDFRNVDYYAAVGENQSEPFRICFYRELSDEEIDGYSAFTDRLDDAEVYEDALEIVKNAEEVTHYTADDAQRLVSFSTVYHISGFWREPYEETDFLGTGKYAVKPGIFKFAHVRETLPEVTVTPAHPEKKDVIALVPFHSDGLPMGDYHGVGDCLARGLNSTFTVKTDREVSLNQLEHLDGYGTVIWFGHGQYFDIDNDRRDHAVPVLYTGEFLNRDVFYSNEEYYLAHRSRSADFASGRIITGSDRAVVGPDFFAFYYNEGSLQDSLWFLSACCSMTNSDLADALLQKGAGSVFGMSEPSKVYYSEDVCFEILINSNKFCL